jgi:hypothetical protein
MAPLRRLLILLLKLYFDALACGVWYGTFEDLSYILIYYLILFYLFLFSAGFYCGNGFTRPWIVRSPRTARLLGFVVREAIRGTCRNKLQHGSCNWILESLLQYWHWFALGSPLERGIASPSLALHIPFCTCAISKVMKILIVFFVPSCRNYRTTAGFFACYPSISPLRLSWFPIIQRLKFTSSHQTYILALNVCGPFSASCPD